LLAAARPAGAADLAKAVAPYLDDRTLVVAHADLTRLDATALLTKMADLAKVDAKEFDSVRQATTRWLADFRKAGGKEAYAFFSLADDRPFLLVPLGEGSDAKAVQQLLRQLLPDQSLVIEPFGAAVFAGDKATLDRLGKLKQTARPEPIKALTSAGEAPVRLAFAPGDDARRIFEEALPTLPPEAGGGSMKIFTRGLRSATIAVETAPKIALRLTIQAADATSAKALREALTHIVAALAKNKELQAAVPDLDRIAALVTFKVSDDRVTLTLDEKDFAAALEPTLRKLRAAAERSRSTHNLKQIVIALHNYHDAHGRFPAAANYDKDGKPLLSWRVHLLPYLEQDELYKQFHLDEPWDSEHNKKLIARMPRLFASSTNPKLAEEGKTTYLAPIGPDTMFMGRTGFRIADVTDGTANTIFLVDAADDRAVVWTRPEDLKYDPKEPFQGLSRRYEGGFLAAFVDGSVHFLPATIDKKTLQALFTRSGGEVVTVP
jgi:hypothetical protein